MVRGLMKELQSEIESLKKRNKEYEDEICSLKQEITCLKTKDQPKVICQDVELNCNVCNKQFN